MPACIAPRQLPHRPTIISFQPLSIILLIVSYQCKGVCIIQYREFLPESLQCLHIDISRYRTFPAPRTFGYRFSVGIDDGAATRIFTGRISSHAVHSGHIALVLNSPRPKQRAPGIHTGSGPACHIKYHVVIPPGCVTKQGNGGHNIPPKEYVPHGSSPPHALCRQ